VTAQALWLARPAGLPETLPIGLAELAPPDDGRDEPILDDAPFFVEFWEYEPELDPYRPADDESDGPTIVEPTEPAGKRGLGSIGSLAIHLLPLLLLLTWTAAPTPPVRQIPIQLVLEPPETPMPEQPPATPGRLASEEFGDVTAQTKQHSAAPAQSAASAAKRSASAAPPPPAAVPREPVMVGPPPPKPLPPTPAPTRQAAASVPAPPTPPKPREAPHESSRAAKYPGPEATRDEYLAYLLVLTRRHIDMLPRSIVGDRQGETVLAIRVRDDGTVARIGVAQSSGYPDIDRRVEQMVAAVGRFPPLPQWLQGPSIELQMKLRFPDALCRSGDPACMH